MTFAVSSNPTSYLNKHGCQCLVYFRVLLCIGHLSTLLQDSPTLKLPVLSSFLWTHPSLSAHAHWSVAFLLLLFVLWKELSLFPGRLPSPSLCKDCLVVMHPVLGEWFSMVLLLLFLLIIPPSAWIEILICTEAEFKNFQRFI